MRFGFSWQRFLNAISVSQKAEFHNGLLDFLKTGNDVQKTLLYEAKKLVQLTFPMKIDAIRLLLATFSERDFRFSKS